MLKSSMARFLVVVAALAACGAAQAVILYDSVELSRDWTKPTANLWGRLRFQVQDQAQPGQTPMERQLYVDVTLRLAAEAPLRIGEVETFRVTGQIISGGTGSYTHQISVVIKPAVAYYAYENISGYLTAYSGQSTVYANGKLVHAGRVRTGAAPAVGEAKVAYTTPDQPLVLSFKDLAFAECAQAPTAYKFTFKKSTLFGTLPLIARGEFPYAEGDRQSVTIEKNGPFTQGAEKWFENGSTYWVLVSFKRTGTEAYTDDFGAPFIARFTWKNGKAADLEVLPGAAAPREDSRERSFDQLYRD